jgi:BNR repeat protein
MHRLTFTIGLALICPTIAQSAEDWRNIRTGLTIPDEGYCDQPYTVITNDGNWLCTMTTGSGHEGQGGQHIVSIISKDQGRTWEGPFDIEPNDGPEASWAMPLVTNSGRVWVFYSYNGDNLRTWNGKKLRVDTVGWYCSKYSDDHGRTWSKKRYRLPLPHAPVDHTNTFGGKHQLFWGIGKPVTHDGSMWFAFSRVGKHLVDNSEGWFFRSDNILRDPPPDEIDWQLLPDGDVGLKATDNGPVNAEQNIVVLSDGSLYCMYRTVTGHPYHAYSRDGGHTWTIPEPATYTPGGRPMKTPRACPRIWKATNGKYLFWFHNHSRIEGSGYKHRNPVWISGGVARDGLIHWSQPEILFYDDDHEIRMSYPDLIEQDGRYWITETQKTIARVHEVDGSLFEGMWREGDAAKTVQDGLILDAGPDELKTRTLPLPGPMNLQNTTGLTIQCHVTFSQFEPGILLLDNRTEDGGGFALRVTDQQTVELIMNDGTHNAAWDCDPGLLRPGVAHHITAIVDAHPGIIMFVVDGQLCDGGKARHEGWSWYDREIADVTGTGQLTVADANTISIHSIRIHNRPLRVSDGVGATASTLE